MKYKLYPSCILVDGVSRSVILDTDYGRYHLIPGTLSKFLKNKILDLETLLSGYNSEDERKIIQEYFNFLLANDFIFEVSEEEADNFIDINLEFKDPFIINDIIIDLSNKNTEHVIYCLDEIIQLKIRHIQLRIFEEIDLKSVYEILNRLNDTIVTSVQLFLPYAMIENFDLKNFLINYPKVVNIFIYNSPNGNKISNDDGRIIFCSEQILSNLHCGVVSSFYFSINLMVISESQKNNSCLNRKIGIDFNGEIKNCPSMLKSYGNISDIRLIDAINSEGFKDVWAVSKNQINICKNCEFRYICIDCRAFIESPDDIYSKPLKCGYDPFTCTWSDWKTDRFKFKAIEYYGMNEIIK